MPENPTPDASSLELLIQEIPLLASWIYQALATPMEYLQAGRSLGGEAVQESLQEVGEYLITFPTMLAELEAGIQKLTQHPSPKDPLPNIIQALQRELAVWKEFQGHVEQLVRRLELMAKETGAGQMGKLPLQDSWEEIRRIATT